jgi:hypothetical protein
MSEEEYLGASQGLWADSPLAQGDAAEMGRKWFWTSRRAAQRWYRRLIAAGEERLVLAEVRTALPMSAYPRFLHPPEGAAVQVPIPDLGPAVRLW